MSDTTMPLNFEITSSINQIPQGTWERIFPADIIEGYGYQKTLEESNLKEFRFRYLLAKENNDIVGILPFFVMEFSINTLLPKLLSRLTAKISRFLKLKIMFLGSVAAEEFYLGLRGGYDLDYFFGLAIQKLRAFSQKEKIRIVVFNNVSGRNRPLMQSLIAQGFTRLETLPTTSLEIKAKSLEEYISGLSKNMRKDLKRKLKKSSIEADLRVSIRDNVDDIIEELYPLYLNNLNSADVSFEILTREFFQRICWNMPQTARYFITYAKDRIVAFNLCLIKKDTCIDKFIGFDREFGKKYHLYFTTFCHNIDWCIKNNIRYYQPGVTDYSPKVRLGAKLIPLYVFAKALNPALDLIIKASAKFIQPKNMDPSLKEIEALAKK
jgi:hypothetical protein